MRPIQNGYNFANDFLKCIFVDENVWIPIRISLKFASKEPISYIPTFSSDNGLVPNGPQAIIGTNDGLGWWRIYESAGRNKFMVTWHFKTRKWFTSEFLLIRFTTNILPVCNWKTTSEISTSLIAQYMMTSSNGNIFRVTGPLCGEFTGPGEFPSQRPVTRSFDVFFDLHLNKRLSKQSRGWRFETPSRPLWRHCNGHL